MYIFFFTLSCVTHVFMLLYTLSCVTQVCILLFTFSCVTRMYTFYSIFHVWHTYVYILLRSQNTYIYMLSRFYSLSCVAHACILLFFLCSTLIYTLYSLFLLWHTFLNFVFVPQVCILCIRSYILFTFLCSTRMYTTFYSLSCVAHVRKLFILFLVWHTCI